MRALQLLLALPVLLPSLTLSVDPGIIDLDNLKLSPSCMRHMLLYIDGLAKGAPWAVAMYDSSTKIPEGLFMGNFRLLGNFDECLLAKSADFQGQYCRAGMQFLIPASIKEISKRVQWYDPLSRDQEKEGRARIMYVKNAYCVPSSCSVEDVRQIAPVLYQASLPVNINVTKTTVKSKDCYVDIPRPINGTSIFFLVVLSLLVCLTVLATLLEVLDKKMWGPLWGPLRAFSLLSNLRQLCDTTLRPGQIPCLNGIRVGSLLWVIIGHRFSADVPGPATNFNAGVDLLSKVDAHTLIGGFVAVDTFFFVGGLLLCYLFMKDLNRGNTFRPLQYYLYRYIRIVMPILAVVFYYATLMEFTGTGPLWNETIQHLRDDCARNWWLNALFINNFMRGYNMCLPQTWYNATDMQFYVLAPLILLPLRLWGRIGLYLLAFLIAISCVIPFTITYIFEFPWNYDFSGNIEYGPNFFYYVYWAPWSRATPYLFGILTAIILLKLKDNVPKLPAWGVLLGWCVCTGLCLAVIYSPVKAYKDDYQYSALDAGFYAGFHRVGWSLGLMWIVMACEWGYGRWVNTLLSLRPWLPLGKLAYCAYLVQYIIIYYYRGTARNPVYIDYMHETHTFFGDVIFIYIISLVPYLLVEAPTGVLLQYLRKQTKASAPVEAQPQSPSEGKDKQHLAEVTVKDL